MAITLTLALWLLISHMAETKNGSPEKYNFIELRLWESWICVFLYCHCLISLSANQASAVVAVAITFSPPMPCSFNCMPFFGGKRRPTTLPAAVYYFIHKIKFGVVFFWKALESACLLWPKQLQLTRDQRISLLDCHKTPSKRQLFVGLCSKWIMSATRMQNHRWQPNQNWKQIHQKLGKL